jgi:hypothetical protein
MHMLSTPVDLLSGKGIASQLHNVTIYCDIVVTTVYFILEIRI